MPAGKYVALTKVDLNELMTTPEIAKKAGMPHPEFVKHVRSTLFDMGLKAADFEATYDDDNGNKQLCYSLPRLERDIVVLSLKLPLETLTGVLKYFYAMEETARALFVENQVFKVRAEKKELAKECKRLTNKNNKQASTIAAKDRSLDYRNGVYANQQKKRKKDKATHKEDVAKNRGQVGLIVVLQKKIKELSKEKENLAIALSDMAKAHRNEDIPEENAMHRGNKYVKECYSGRRKPTNEMNELMGQFDNVVYDMEEIVRKLGEELARSK